MIFYVVDILDDWNVDVPSWKYPRNLESPRVSSPGFDNDSKRKDRVVVYSASTPQVWGSINGLRKTDHQIGTSVHAPHRPMVTCIMMGTVVPGPHGLLCH
ncbi:hypothetical protein TNCV_1867501 [Trichonephila clavipes]|nr:hypothetical protein TNCV_1867501 [Trichonephila clavipes]